jgi:hypothetical protein
VGNPAIYLEPVYWAELRQRTALGFHVNLDWRQEHPAVAAVTGPDEWEAAANNNLGLTISNLAE